MKRSSIFSSSHICIICRLSAPRARRLRPFSTTSVQKQPEPSSPGFGAFGQPPKPVQIQHPPPPRPPPPPASLTQVPLKAKTKPAKSLVSKVEVGRPFYTVGDKYPFRKQQDITSQTPNTAFEDRIGVPQYRRSIGESRLKNTSPKPPRQDGEIRKLEYNPVPIHSKPTKFNSMITSYIATTTQLANSP
jgi:hypothetical protein